MSTFSGESPPRLEPRGLLKGPGDQGSGTYRAPVFLVSLSPETAEPEVRVSPGTQPDTPALVLEGGQSELVGEAVSLSSHSESG